MVVISVVIIVGVVLLGIILVLSIISFTHILMHRWLSLIIWIIIFVITVRSIGWFVCGHQKAKPQLQQRKKVFKTPKLCTVSTRM